MKVEAQQYFLPYGTRHKVVCIKAVEEVAVVLVQAILLLEMERLLFGVAGAGVGQNVVMPVQEARVLLVVMEELLACVALE
jgi:hypothetical protein